MSEKPDLWLMLDLFVRIMTMLAIVVILAKYMQGAKLTIFIILFILWAFRPLYLTLKELKVTPEKLNKEKLKINKTIILKIFLIIIIPILLSLIFIPNNKTDLEFIEEGNETFRQVSLDNFYNPDSWIDNINKLFGIPFDLNYYHFCFEDINTTSKNSDHIEYSNFSWSVIVKFRNIEESLSLSNFDRDCTKKSFFVTEKIFFDSSLNSTISIYPGIYYPESTSISPNTRVYATPNQKTMWIKRAIFVISLFSLIWLSTRIRLMIQKGWLES